MGTRSLTVFKDSEEEEIAVLYRQFDGYPEGHGKDLLDALGADAKLVNGYGAGPHKYTYNGMPDLAVRIIARLKHQQEEATRRLNKEVGKNEFRPTPESVGDEIGNFYLHPAGARDCGEEYVYVLLPMNGETAAGEVRLIVRDCYAGDSDREGLLYDGPVSGARVALLGAPEEETPC